MSYIAYTSNEDTSINVLAGSDNPAVFPAILPQGSEFEVHEGEVYTAGGKTYLSEDDPAYIEAKEQEEKQKAIADLNAQYDSDKAVLVQEYTDALMHDDSDMADEIKAEMTALDEQYDADYEEIMNGGAE